MGYIDCHVHTLYSDGITTPEEVCRKALELGIEIVVTDHNTIEGALATKRLAETNPDFKDVKIIIGEEITTVDFAHIIAIGLEKAIEVPIFADDAIDQIHEQGGFANLAHSCHYSHGRLRSFGGDNMLQIINALKNGDNENKLLKTFRKFDGIETYNSTPWLSWPYVGGYNQKTFKFYEEFWKLGVPLIPFGGSDAHVPYAIGKGSTDFEGKDFLKDLKFLQDLKQKGILTREIVENTIRTTSKYYTWLQLAKYLAFYINLKWEGED